MDTIEVLFERQITMTVGSCMYSHIGSYIESMYIGSSCMLIRMTVGSSMHSNFGSFIYLSLPIPRPIPLPPPLPLSIHPSSSPLFSLSISLSVPSLSLYISLYIYPMSFYLSLSLSLSNIYRASIQNLSRRFPDSLVSIPFSPYLSFLSALLYRSKHLACFLHLLCWILVVFVHWIFDCFVSVAILSIKPLISCTHILVAFICVV